MHRNFTHNFKKSKLIGNDLLDMIPKAQTRVKIDKWDFIKIWNFSVSKDTVNRVRRQSTEWEKNICKS